MFVLKAKQAYLYLITMSSKNILIHVFGCVIFLSLPILSSPEIDLQFELIHSPPFQRSFISTCLLLVFFYANYYVFMPRLYVSKKYGLFLLVIIACFLIVVFIPELVMIGRKMGPKPPHDFHPPGPPKKSFMFFLLNHNLFQFLGVFVFSMMLKLRERLKQIETEKTNAELSYLKAQINPHFLFNTLNSIYSLAIQKHDKTADAVVKLSDMMRYVLNDGNKKFVFMEQELNYISNYIELQKMRLTSNVELLYDYEGSVEDKKIAPLVLIPFIENAFKHGVNSEENSRIEIKISIMDTELHLYVKNNCVSINNNTLNKSGLGIENTKQRLQLLYPQSHTLKISKQDNCFIVNLNLNIHD